MRFGSSVLYVTAVGLAVGCAACSTETGPRTVDKTAVAQQVSTKLKEQVGKAPDIVACPQNLDASVGATLTCTLTEKGTVYNVVVTVSSVKDDDVEFGIKVADHPNP